MMPYPHTHRPETLRAGRPGAVGSCQPHSCDAHFAGYPQRAEWISMGAWKSVSFLGQAGLPLPCPVPTGGNYTLSLVLTASVLQQEHQRPRSQGRVGTRTQGSCCPAPGTEDPEGKHVSPPDRGSFCCTGLRLFSAMTLARSWD